MKAGYRKILSWLLVLTMVMAMIPAALADEGDPTPADPQEPAALTVTVSPKTQELKVGETAALTATVTPEDTENKTVTWSSSAEDIVSVSESGELTAKKPGTATITATSVASEDAKDTCEVTVKSAATAITLDGLNEGKLTFTASDMEAKTLTATVTGAVDGETLDVQFDPEVVDVTVGAVSGEKAQITVTPKNKGTATVTLTCGDATASFDVEVQTGEYKLTVESDPLEVTVGATKGNKVTFTPALESATLEYASKDESIATVDASGAVTGVAEGETEITVTLKSGDVKLAEKTYKVKVVGKYKITFDFEKKEQTVGASQEITVRVSALQDDGKYKPFSGIVNVEWSVDTADGIAAFKEKHTQSTGSASNLLMAYSTGSRIQRVEVTMTATVTVTDKDTGETTTTQKEVIKIRPAQASTFSISENKKMNASSFAAVVNSAVAGKYTNITMDGIGIRDVIGGKIYDGTTANEVRPSEQPRIYKSGANEAYKISDLFFVASKGAGEKSFEYIAYNKEGNVIAFGIVRIGSGADIEYTTSIGSTVRFKESDFYNFVYSAANSRNLSYVCFDVSAAKVSYAGKSVDLSSYESSFGAFYTSSTQKSRLYSSDRCYYRATSLQTALGSITYAPGSYTKEYTVILPFTAYYETSASTTLFAVDGYVYIYVNTNDTITMVGGQLSSAAAAKTVSQAYANADYVTFTLPARDEGTLCYNFRTIVRQNYARVASTDRFYLNDTKQYMIDDVFFLPAADCASTIRIGYTAYDASGSKLGTGYLPVNIVKTADSRVFSDVTSKTCGSWAADSVDFMNYYGLVKGVSANRFNYGGNMTRGDFVLILYRYAGEPTVAASTNPFRDVTTKDYYHDAVVWAYRTGVVTGTSNTTFSPKGFITREQIAAILYRMTESPSGSSSLTGFADYRNVSAYAEKAMSWAVGNGYVKGSGRNLNPKSNATRAEVVVMLHRFLTK